MNATIDSYRPTYLAILVDIPIEKNTQKVIAIMYLFIKLS